MNFAPSKKYFKCKRCKKWPVIRVGASEKYCDECKPIVARESVYRWIKKHKKKKGRKCRRCKVVKVSKGKHYCATCRDLNIRKSIQKSMKRGKVEEARSKPLTSTRKSYNIKNLGSLSTEKFGKAVTECLQDKALFVGVR